MTNRSVDINQNESSLNEWTHIVMNRDWDSLPDLLVDNVTYHNPAQLEPLYGKNALVGTLKLVFGIFEDFEYMRNFSGDDGHVLEFRGRVADVPFTGMDIVRFDDMGKIVDLVVMIRPVGAIIKLGEVIEQQLA